MEVGTVKPWNQALSQLFSSFWRKSGVYIKLNHLKSREFNSQDSTVSEVDWKSCVLNSDGTPREYDQGPSG